MVGSKKKSQKIEEKKKNVNLKCKKKNLLKNVKI